MMLYLIVVQSVSAKIKKKNSMCLMYLDYY